MDSVARECSDVIPNRTLDLWFSLEYTLEVNVLQPWELE
jgi:hypothetical protein